MSSIETNTSTGRRNARILALCQGLYICAISVDLTLTGLTGYQIAPDKAMVTLPFALITAGAALCSASSVSAPPTIANALALNPRYSGAVCGCSGPSRLLGTRTHQKQEQA